MAEPKCSIIVPIYKSEEYLVRCIRSVLQQTYKNWELILIDDGSPDNSGVICQDYSYKESRIRVYHQKNQGVSSARNLGLEKMSGDYVLFLDSDDWLDKNCIDFCMKEMLRTKVDLMQFPTERVNKEIDNATIFNAPIGRVYKTQQYIRLNDYFICIGGTVIAATLIQRNNLRFRNDIKLAEDQIFIMDCIRLSKKIYRSDTPFYKYYINDNGATNNSKSPVMINSITALIAYKKEYPIYENRIDYTLYYFLWYIIKNNDVSQMQVCGLIKKAQIKDNEKFSKVEKIFILLGNRIPLLSIYFLKIYNLLKL